MEDSLQAILVVSDGGAETEWPVVWLRGREALSELFHFTIDVRATDEPFPAGPGARGELRFLRDGETFRSVFGLFARVALRLDGDGKHPTHRLTLVPRAHRLTMVTTQQIFMDLSVQDIARRKSKLVGLRDEDVRWNVLGDDPEREFIVQYRETDLTLLSRLAENRGVAFYFAHEDGADRLVFSDHNDGLMSDDACASIALSDHENAPRRVHALTREEQMIPSVYVVHDYNYRAPGQTLKASEKLTPSEGGGIVEYGCHVKSEDEAKALAALRAQELSCRKTVYLGESSIPELRAGLRTKIEETETMAETPVIITAVEHEITPLSGGGTAGVYKNSFEAVSSDATYRPVRRTPRPAINGVVTAIVQGAEGADASQIAQIDEHGRYVVQFHFDSGLGKATQKASRPVRKAQPFAGQNDGMHFPLRPGTEVAIAFADGDPDRPIIFGALPNHAKPSVIVDAEATVNRIQTDSGITIQFGSK